MLNPQLVYPFLRRGSVWCFHGWQFESGQVRRKYCVVMQDYDKALATTVVVLTTSNMRFADRPWTVLIPEGTIADLPGDTLVDLQNAHEVSLEAFCGERKCQYMDQLPPAVMDLIDHALEHATRLPPEMVLRMRRLRI